MGTMMKRLLLIAAAFSTLAACGYSSGDETEHVGLAADTALPGRRGAIVIDGCLIDTWSRSTLALPSTKKVAQEVIMLCAVPRADGTVGPRDESASAHLATLVSVLHAEGYRVNLGVAFTDESGQRYDGAQTSAYLSNQAWRARFVETLPAVLAPFDGAEIDLQKLPNDARPNVTELVSAIAAKIRPEKKLNAFIPPSVTVPSDLPGGDAFSRLELGPHLDRMRIMTLDFSETSPDPTTRGWASPG
jgi:hypothetical protein